MKNILSDLIFLQNVHRFHARLFWSITKFVGVGSCWWSLQIQFLSVLRGFALLKALLALSPAV